MTYVKRMEVQGFKSFANKMSVDFDRGFSVFLGANGSGKSNVIDALCFVLGKTSKKSMRADMLTDLIFNGGKEGRPAKYAEVSLIFDNKEKVFPYEGEEFKIGRRVLDKGASIFKINEKQVKREEILNALSMTRIDPNGFNIILQGDIQKFVDLSPEERLQVIEDMSGISVYEDKKKKSLRELDKVEDKLKEARTILAEKEKYLKEIINDKKQAEKFIKMQAELREKKANLLFKKIHDQEQEKITFDDKLTDNNKLLDENAQKIIDNQKQIDTFSIKLTSIKHELEKKGDAQQQALTNQIDQNKGKRIQLEGVISNHTSQLERIKQRNDNVNKELIDAENSIKKAKAELKIIESKTKLLKQDIETKRASCGINEEGRLSVIKEELLSVEEELFQLNNKLMLLNQSEESAKEVTHLKAKLINYESNLKKVNESLDKNDSKRAELIPKRLEVEKYLNYLLSQKAKLEARKDVFKDFGNKGVNSIINLGFKGIHGTIASLGLIDKQYTTALSVTAGRRLNALVTSDDVIAQKCIEHLRQNKLGTATFIPLNKVSGNPLRHELARLKQTPGVVDFAINLVRFDEKYRKAFELVLGETLIINNLETARKINARIRMVTIEGDLVETTGVMTGGFRGNKSAGFISNDGEEQLVDTENKIKKYETYRKDINETLNIISEEVLRDREEKARLTSLISELKNNLDRLNSKLIDAADADKIRKQINDLDKKKKEFKLTINNTASNKEVNNARQELKIMEDEYNSLMVDGSTTKAQLDKLLIKEKDRLSNIIKELNNESQDFKKELSKAREELSIINKKLIELKKEEIKFHDELAGLYKERDLISKKIDSGNKIIDELEKKNYSIKEKNQEINMKRATVLAKIEGLKVSFNDFKDCETKLIRKEVSEIQDEINQLDSIIKNFGPVNMKSIETYKEVEKEFDKVKTKTDELSGEKDEITKVIDDVELRKKKAFIESFNEIKNNFENIFAMLSPGGIAKLLLDNKDDPFEGGVIAIVKPKGKKILTLKSMSGGEKTLTALAFIFAIQCYSPTPFYVMDEVDAALDKANTERLAQMILEYSGKSQFIVISHNDDMISTANYLYGVSMDKRGVSNIVSLKLPE
ncbi:MAG: chromosome segregation protein SMC [Candidatus Nanoarchaeia archaeon]|jgi:chromosome segregation protein